MFTLSNFKEHLPPYEIEMISEVGSRMWNMQTPESDYDILVIYSESLRTLLSGRKIHETLNQKLKVTINDELCDIQYLELSHFINLLKKGNINALWGILSL